MIPKAFIEKEHFSPPGLFSVLLFKVSCVDSVLKFLSSSIDLLLYFTPVSDCFDYHCPVCLSTVFCNLMMVCKHTVLLVFALALNCSTEIQHCGHISFTRSFAQGKSKLFFTLHSQTNLQWTSYYMSPVDLWGKLTEL